MIKQGLLWGDRRSLYMECTDTIAGRQTPSLRWLTFHTYEKPQCPELKDRVMMSAQVPSYCGKQKDRCERGNEMKGSADAVVRLVCWLSKLINCKRSSLGPDAWLCSSSQASALNHAQRESVRGFLSNVLNNNRCLLDTTVTELPRRVPWNQPRLADQHVYCWVVKH